MSAPKKRRGHGRGCDAAGRSEIPNRFVGMPYWVLESPAALRLSGNAFKVLVYLAKRFNGSNNGTLRFGVRTGCTARNRQTKQLEDVPIGLARSVQQRALKELLEAGFIREVTPSSFHQKRLVREWRITWLPTNGGLATNEFTHMIPDTSPLSGTESAAPEPLTDHLTKARPVKVPSRPHSGTIADQPSPASGSLSSYHTGASLSVSQTRECALAEHL